MQPLVNEKDPSGVPTIVRNQFPTHRLDGGESFWDGSMPLPLRVPPDSLSESEVTGSVLPRDRTSALPSCSKPTTSAWCGWPGCWSTTVRQPRTW
jgi:hypothetical protein